VDDLAQRQASDIEPQLAIARHSLIGPGHLEAHPGRQLTALTQRALHLCTHVFGKAGSIEIEGIAMDGDATARLLP